MEGLGVLDVEVVGVVEGEARDGCGGGGEVGGHVSCFLLLFRWMGVG